MFVILALIFSDLEVEIITFLKNYKLPLLSVVFLSLACPTLRADEAETMASEKNVIQFQGVGNKSTEVDPKLYSSEVHGGKIEPEKQSTIKLSDGAQKLADDAGRTIKNIDNTMLDSVNHALHLLHLEAESAKLRPKDGGVGLGISINLDKGKKQEEPGAKASQSDSEVLYDALRPTVSPDQ